MSTESPTQPTSSAAAAPPPAFAAQLAMHQAHQAAAAAAPLTGSVASEPLPREFAYRRQDANGNGVVLLALRQDTTWAGAKLEGFVEFTALDNESVASSRRPQAGGGAPGCWCAAPRPRRHVPGQTLAQRAASAVHAASAA